MTAKDAISPQNTFLTSSPEDKKADSARKKPVSASSPLTMALERMASGEEVVTVIDDVTETPIGIIDRESMIKAVAGLFPQLDESAELTITCPPSQYSASAIAHAVEDADAHLLNLNVTAGTEPNSLTTVLLRVNHSRGESVARSLARYGYETVEIATPAGMPASDMIERARAFMRYLEV